MSVARTARRRRCQAANGNKHLAKLGRSHFSNKRPEDKKSKATAKNK